MTDTDIVMIDDAPDSEDVSIFTVFVKGLFGVAAVILVWWVFVMIMFSLIMGPTIDWRDPVNLQLEDGVFHEVENGTMVEPFNGTHHDLVPGDKIILGIVPFTHLSTQSSTSCSSGWDDDYDSMSQDCWTTYWDVFDLDVGGMNFSIDGDKGFMHTCFNAFCNVTATVNGDDYWGLDMYAGRLSITVQEFDWVRWCQGEGVCE